MSVKRVYVLMPVSMGIEPVFTDFPKLFTSRHVIRVAYHQDLDRLRGVQGHEYLIYPNEACIEPRILDEFKAVVAGRDFTVYEDPEGLSGRFNTTRCRTCKRPPFDMCGDCPGYTPSFATRTVSQEEFQSMYECQHVVNERLTNRLHMEGKCRQG